MHNREYQKRASRQGIRSLQEFYRPAKRPDPRPRCLKSRGGPEQLTLNFDFDPIANRPLNDIFPDAYE